LLPPGYADEQMTFIDTIPATMTSSMQVALERGKRLEASYFRVRDGDAELWTYRHPDPEAAAIAGHVATAEQPGVQIIVDGIPERQP
jgi:uncharacterized protein (DUF427 family)